MRVFVAGLKLFAPYGWIYAGSEIRSRRLLGEEALELLDLDG